MKEEITIEALKRNNIARSVDTRGTRSPGTLVEVKKVLDSMNAGEILEVLSTDNKTKNDFSSWCAKQGYEFLGAHDEEGFFKLYLEKK
jgi:TusA-related sulfurtransferase